MLVHSNKKERNPQTQIINVTHQNYFIALPDIKYCFILQIGTVTFAKNISPAYSTNIIKIEIKQIFTCLLYRVLILSVSCDQKCQKMFLFKSEYQSETVLDSKFLAHALKPLLLEGDKNQTRHFITET